MTEIFVLCSGQDDNIGDVVLRRALLRSLRQYGELHIYLASPSEGFTEALELSPDDVVYNSMKSWRKSAYSAARKTTIWFVDKPGELQMSSRAILAQIRNVPINIAARVGGGRVLRLGIGQRHPRTLQKWALRGAFMFSNQITWRDTTSHRDFKIGRVMPDWGFLEVGRNGGTHTAGRRTRAVLSYRSDKPRLSDATISAIKELAERADLDLVVVAQVQRDSAPGAALAESLGADFIGWPESRSHAEQEELLRRVYEEAAIVLSDRLHVLIVAATEGAIPVSVVSYVETKVARHFDAIGYRSMAFNTSDMDAPQILEVLTGQLERSLELQQAVESAVQTLESVSEALPSRDGRNPKIVR